VRALALPDDPAGLPTWLESELVGLHLRQLAAELAVVHRGAAPAGSFADWLAGHRDDVLHRGLGTLPPGKLGELLRRPDWLLELHRLVLTDGGPYWDAVARSPELEERVERSRRALANRFDPRAEPARRSRWWTMTVLPAVAASLATAAAVLLVVHGLDTEPSAGKAVAVAPTPEAAPAPAAKGFRKTEPPGSPPAPSKMSPKGVEPPLPAPAALATSEGPTWGFEKFAAVKPGVGREEYLRQLAAAAKEWSAKRPTDAAGLAKRIGEFRRGCSEILLAEHTPLPPADRAWLKDRCRQWAAALDKHLTALEAGGDAAAVRAEVDDTATKIAAALLGRADTPPG
jgi:hypothetical protein